MTNFVNKIKNASLILRWLEQPDAKELFDAISEVGIDNLKKIRKESDEKEIFRLQGKLEVISALQDLKKELKESIERKTSPHAVLEQKRTTP